MGTNISDLVQIPSQEIVIPSTASVLEVLSQRANKGGYKGARAVSAKMLNSVEGGLVEELVLQSLGEPLRDDYFAKLSATDSQVLIEMSNRGIAIVNGEYLDILAVNTADRRNGVGSGLMYDALKLSGALYWRSQTFREANEQFYKKIMSTPVTFDGIDGRHYFGFVVGLSPEAFAEAALEMQQKPKNYK